jgi:hypothetical protein
MEVLMWLGSNLGLLFNVLGLAGVALVALLAKSQGKKEEKQAQAQAEASAQGLTRFKSPWLTGEIEWTEKTIRKAVCSMAMELNKPLLILTSDDYFYHVLASLL